MSITYDRKDILSLRLRASAGLGRLTRRELFSRLQLIRDIEPVVADAYKEVLRRTWREGLDDAPHGHPWHVSFHASQFPGDDPFACARQALYRMMDLPSSGPPSRWLHLTATAGKNIEIDIVEKFFGAGILISAPPDAEVQTGFEIPEVRLTGSVDSAIVFRKRPTPIEIKTKHEATIAKMKIGAVGPDDSHVKQIKTQMGLIRAAQEAGGLWADLKPCDRGYIYYQSRDNPFIPPPFEPVETAEFLVEYDPVWYETGLEVLKRWMAYWEEEMLPSINPSKRHPNGWRWSYPPCQFCNYKKICQADHKAGISDLSESTGIEVAQEIRPDYRYEDARARVETRWDEDE